MASKTTSKRTTSKRTSQQKAGPYRKAPRKRKSVKRRRGYQSSLPQLSQWSQSAQNRLSGLHMPQLSSPKLSWFNWSGRHWSKIVSILLMIVGVAGVLWVHMDYHWFVYADTVEFENLSYLTAEELYPATELEGLSVFWIMPNEVSEQVAAHPYVSDVNVRVHLPNRVIIDVAEQKPIAIWMTGSGPMWLLPDGAALEIRTVPDQPLETQLLDDDGQMLPTIVDVQQSAVSVKAKHLALDPDVLASALVLMEAMPGLDSVRYNKGVGLNFALPGSDYWVYWGDGLDLTDKLENLALSRQLLDSGEYEGQILDVRYSEHPIIR